MTYIQKNSKTELHRKLEQIEIDAWQSIYVNITKKINRNWKTKTVSNTLLSFAPDFDILTLNRVNGLGLFEYPSSELLETIKNEYKQLDIPRIFAQVYIESDKSINQKLNDYGFIHRNNWVKLYLDCTTVRQKYKNTSIRRITQKNDPLFGEIVAKAFDWSENLIPYFNVSIGAPNWMHYISYDLDKPVGTASMFVKDKVAWIGFGATIPEARGKGIQKALTAQRISDAGELGVELISVETGEDRPEHSVPSHRNMIRCGFNEAYIRPNYLFEF